MLDDDLEVLFYDLVDRSPAERRAGLREIDARSPELGRAVGRLLDAHDASPSFLSPPFSGNEGDRPARLGKYEVERELGRGAAGVVYLGHDPDLNRPVAIKTLAVAGARRVTAERLRGEGRALASVVHPNVAQVYTVEDVSQPDGPERSILTMELVPGTTLAARLRGGPLPLELSLDYGRQIAAALEAVHLRSIVHRDLKPQNIRVTAEGWVKVLDFGLAELFSPESAGQAPSGGTPGYMSPEQCRGEPVDHRADLWAFGAVLGECLTGEPVVRGTKLSEILTANRRGEIRLDLPPSLPGPIAVLVRALLEPDPGRRVASATHARRVLEEELLRLRAGAFLAPSPSSRTPDLPPPEAERRGNLPRPFSSFVGRTAFLDKLATHLLEHRLVTITGPGGAGKTRTSVETAAREEQRFPGGVWFVDLAAVTNPSDVPSAVVRSLGARETAGDRGRDALAQAIVAFFQDQAALLVLDNCEHLLDGVTDFVSGLLALPSRVTILATSRQPLGLSGEEVLSLPPLALPHETGEESPDQVSPDPDAGTQAEAVELFLRRAQSRTLDFAPTAPMLGIVKAICVRLDGLPLAIELAAGYARALPLEEILRRANESRALSGAHASGHPRHRSLHDLVDWSYRLLPAKERSCLRRLSVFRGGWTLATAESVCGGWGGIEGWELCDLLARLVERSLVEPDLHGRDPGSGGAMMPARYHLLETIRGFAAERLDEEDGERADLEARYLEGLVALAAARPDETGPTHFAFVRRIEPDYANLVHGLELALSTGRLDAAFALGEATSYYWVLRSQLVDGMRWMDRLRAARQKAMAARGRATPSPISGRSEEPWGRGREVRFLSRAGLVACLLAATDGERESARRIADEALALARELGTPDALAHAHATLANVIWRQGELDAAREAWEKSRRLFAEAGDSGRSAVQLGNLGVVESSRGNHEAALEHFRQYAQISRSMGNRHAEAISLLNVGWTVMTLGSLDEARSSLETALTYLEASGDVNASAMAHQSLGEVTLSQGDHDLARTHLLESCRLRVRTGDRVGLSSSIMFLARLADREQRLDVAAQVLGGLLRMIDAGELPCAPERLASLREWRDDLATRLGEAKAAGPRGEALDLGGLLALVSPVR